jgi:hypothetical protein
MENSMTTMERNFEISMPYQEEDVMWWEVDWMSNEREWFMTTTSGCSLDQAFTVL